MPRKTVCRLCVLIVHEVCPLADSCLFVDAVTAVQAMVAQGIRHYFEHIPDVADRAAAAGSVETELASLSSAYVVPNFAVVSVGPSSIRCGNI